MIQREQYIRQIRPFIGTDLVKVLTGMRRSGKSVMLQLIQEELLSQGQGYSSQQFITLNFESLANEGFRNAQSLYKELSRHIAEVHGKAFLFLDEIQEVTNWEQCINSLRVDFDCDIYVTGSNARLLSGELATNLAGRYIRVEIFPFSFKEFLESRCIPGQTRDVRTEFQAFIDFGGMPFLSHLQNDRNAALQYLRDIYNSVILKDVVKRHNIRDVDQLERIVTYMMANIGHTFSARNISDYIKNEKRSVSPETVMNYIKACREAYLFAKVSREDLTGKRLLTINEKYYMADHGIREAVYGGNTRDMDQLLENIVCIELLRQGYEVTIGKAGEKEIDFIAKKGAQKFYVQVCYLLASPETIEREFGVYDKVPDHYPKYVLSLDEFDMSRNGIRHRNIRDFLLSDFSEI